MIYFGLQPPPRQYFISVSHFNISPHPRFFRHPLSIAPPPHPPTNFFPDVNQAILAQIDQEIKIVEKWIDEYLALRATETNDQKKKVQYKSL